MPASTLSATPPHTLRPFWGAQTTVDTMLEQIRGPRGERSLKLRSLTEAVIRHLKDKDYLSEILAIRNFVATHVRYVNDPLTTEWVKDPERLADEILAYGRTAADCDEIASLIAAMLRQVGREADIVVVGFGRAGSFSHVFARGKEPKTSKMIVCDPVAGTDELSMLRRVKTYKIWRID
jgi:transglutaminase-like putative cysteine protease